MYRVAAPLWSRVEDPRVEGRIRIRIDAEAKARRAPREGHAGHIVRHKGGDKGALRGLEDEELQETELLSDLLFCVVVSGILPVSEHCHTRFF